MGEIFGFEVPLPQSFLDPIIAKVVELLRPIIGPINAIVGIFTRFRDTVPGTLDAARHLIDSCINEYQQFTTFSFRVSPRTRVIQSIRAYQELTDLITKIPQDVLTHVKALFTTLKTRLGAGETFSPEDIEGLEDLRGLIRKLGTRFAAAFEKLFGILALLLDAFVAIRNTIDDLQHIVDDIKHAREIVTDLQGIFLQQGNRRERLKLEDGSIYYRRIPHSNPRLK